MDQTESKEGASRSVRRAGVKKEQQPKRRSWRESTIFRYLPDLLILLLALLAIFLLFNPFARMLDEASGSWRRFMEPLAANGLGVVIGAVLWLIALVAAGYRLRWRINNARRFWARRCPACGGDDLRRVRRIRRDRLLEHLGIPVRRYICPECRWIGARIDQHLV